MENDPEVTVKEPSAGRFAAKFGHLLGKPNQTSSRSAPTEMKRLPALQTALYRLFYIDRDALELHNRVNALDLLINGGSTAIVLIHAALADAAELQHAAVAMFWSALLLQLVITHFAGEQ